jgi:hypothetical protein
MREHNDQRTMVEMGLAGVAATQLWHHTDGNSVLSQFRGFCPNLKMRVS